MYGLCSSPSVFVLNKTDDSGAAKLEEEEDWALWRTGGIIPTVRPHWSVIKHHPSAVQSWDNVRSITVAVFIAKYYDDYNSMKPGDCHCGFDPHMHKNWKQTALNCGWYPDSYVLCTGTQYILWLYIIEHDSTTGTQYGCGQDWHLACAIGMAGVSFQPSK